MSNFINQKLTYAIGKFASLNSIIALKNGVIATLPLTIVGSILLLLCNLPIDSARDFISNSGLKDIFLQGYYATFSLLSIVSTIAIAYNYSKLEKQDALGAGVIALVLFVLLMRNSVTTSDNVIVENVISKDWTSAKGMVSAIIIGLFVGKFYSFLLKKGISIKMPSGVPEGVSKSFASLIPATIIIIIGMIVYTIFNKFNTTFLDWIYSVIQTPLQGLTDSLGAVIIIAFIVPFLTLFGIHGATIITSVINPILLANTEINNKIIESGLELTVQNGGRIVSASFVDLFINLSGTGVTLGLILYLVAFSKSTQCKQIGKLSLLPGIFNINEPVIFGTPIVMNPILALPFILMPVISGVLLYLSQYFGLVPLFKPAILPWTTPPIISGFIIGGFSGALVQLVILVISFFIYLPFIKKIDIINLNNEKNNKSNL